MHTCRPYIFRTEPVVVPRVWGGHRLAELFGVPTDAGAAPGEPVGEWWQVADLPEGQSRVANGPLSGATLGELVRLWGTDLVGSRGQGQEAFPLLVKWLDARDDLSIQVHPGPEHAGIAPHGARPKDECWIVHEVDQGASVLHGFREELDGERFVAACQAGHIAEFMNRVPVSPGDVLRVAPGTVHAICRGVVLLEIQQPSDTTYRVYDYDRPGLDGRPRALHLEEALAVAHLQAEAPVIGHTMPEPGSANFGTSPLVSSPAYQAEFLRVSRPLSWSVSATSPQVVTLLGGGAWLGPRLASHGASHGMAPWPPEGAVRLERGQSAVVPASMGPVALWPDAAHDGDSACEAVVAGLGGTALLGEFTFVQV